MYVERLGRSEATIVFSMEELEMLCHAISEACAEVPERGFKTRVTVTTEDAEEAHAEVYAMLQDARAYGERHVTVRPTGRELLFFCSVFNEALNSIRKAAPRTDTETDLVLAEATHQSLRAIFRDVDLD